MTHDPYRVEPRKPSIERVNELLAYEPETGVFRWKVARLIGKGMQKLPPGSVAGTMRKGYVLIGIDGVQYSAHRLAWLVSCGEWPSEDIDHINRQPNDNRIANLRKASRTLNLLNTTKRSDNTNGTRGVWYWAKRKKWKAYICGKTIGYFDTQEDAAAAYDEARKVWMQYEAKKHA